MVSGNSQGLNQALGFLGPFVSRIQEACYGPCEEDLPEKSCEDNLIVVKESEESKIYQEENCIFIEGGTGAIDAFFYRLFEFI